MEGNREYKSDVFSMLMQDKEKALQVYNAVNGSYYSDPDEVEIVTLDKGISLTVRNDAAFIVDASLSVYEHQSTVCPNMPIRSLVYFSNILERMLKGRQIYGRRKMDIPIPKFVVFYNGEESQPETYDMRLSDLFSRKVETPDLEVVCHVFNINNGKNQELLSKCSVLADYMQFVTYVREFHDKIKENLQDAIEQAIDRCIREDILADFLMEHRWEVVKVVQLDYTFDTQIMLERQESREEGREEGKEIGREEERKQLTLAVSRLKAGETADEIIQSGINRETVELALSCIE